MEKKYVVMITNTYGGSEDTDYEYFDTLEEANRHAGELWKHHFTLREQKYTTIETCWVTPEMVDESLRYDDDDEWWELCNVWDGDENCVKFGK